MDRDQRSISIFAEETGVTLDQFLPEAVETSFHALLTDRGARETAAAQTIEKKQKNGLPALKAPAENPPKDVKRCPACSEKVRNDANVCRYCGYDFDGRRFIWLAAFCSVASDVGDF